MEREKAFEKGLSPFFLFTGGYPQTPNSIHFLARSEKTNQKRGATPKALSLLTEGYLNNPNPFFLRPCGSKRAELESRKKGLRTTL